METPSNPSVLPATPVAFGIQAMRLLTDIKALSIEVPAFLSNWRTYATLAEQATYLAELTVMRDRARAAANEAFSEYLRGLAKPDLSGLHTPIKVGDVWVLKSYARNPFPEDTVEVQVLDYKGEFVLFQYVGVSSKVSKPVIDFVNLFQFKQEGGR